MGKIPVVVVDDNETDRYIARRRLSKDADFGEVLEVEAGDLFLEAYFNGHQKVATNGQPLLVLMDINMPRMNGFETVQELQDRQKAGKGPPQVVVMMFTSSQNPEDMARANALETVKAYINKPLDVSGVQKIREAYQA